MRIQIITPASSGSQRGNRVTAERWAAHLREFGHVVEVSADGQIAECDVLIALHARRSAQAVREFHQRWPARPLVLVLTGTDLYRDVHVDAAAQHSLELATHIVVLQSRGRDELPAHLHARTRTIVQSAVAPTGVLLPTQGKQICVLGHLREVKDPFRAAAAVRDLPTESELHVVHIGGALDAEMETRARAEQQANPRYSWLGELPRADALQILRASFVHVLSSEMEGGANAVCEALACGVPTISSEIAGSIGLLGADYPGYYPLRDTAALARLLRRCELDADFYAELERRCADCAELVRPERERDGLRELMRDCVPSTGL